MAKSETPAHLKHLRQDRRGLPVPYINRWGPEDVTRIEIRHDRHARRDGVFYRDADLDTPDFTAQNMGRQRECVLAGLCQVCGRRVPWSRRFLVVSDISVEVIPWAGGTVGVVTEPWLCSWCHDFATRVCPALIRRDRVDNLTTIPVTSKRQVAVIVSEGWVDGPHEAATRANPVAMWGKVALLHHTVRIGSRS